jgi:glutamate synthase (NADPH/NADH) large chain
VLGWRDVPVDASAIGPMARDTMPAIRQLFIGREGPRAGFDRTLFMVRKRAGRTASVTLGGDDFYVCSCSSRTVVYKGLMLAEQLGAFYPDLLDPRTVSRLALVHSRFSTNTFPTLGARAPVPLRSRTTARSTRSRQPGLDARPRGSCSSRPTSASTIEDFKPIIRSRRVSDSASLDNVVDFLVASGRSLPHVMMMLVPEAYRSDDPTCRPRSRAFYDYHACLVEPWDGPAALAFTDGDLVGAMLDRNGLRPAKYAVTSDGLVVLASELGVLPLDPPTWCRRGGSSPGRMFLVDTREGASSARRRGEAPGGTRQPYRAWLARTASTSTSCPRPERPYAPRGRTTSRLHQVFGYTEEDLTRVLLAPMAETGEEPVGSMGVDAPLAVLSERPQSLFRYFKQQFAQVTNPPIDPIREAVVMSLTSCVGGEGNLLDETPNQCRMLELKHPVLTNDELAKLAAAPHGRLPGLHHGDASSPGTPGGAGRRGAAGALAARGRCSAARPARRSRGRLAASCPTATWDPGTFVPMPSAARPGGGAPRPHPHGLREGGPRRGVGRAPRGGPPRAAGRLRRGRGEPLPRLETVRRARAQRRVPPAEARSAT